MINRNQVLELVKLKGPVIPSDINSELKENTMIVGAFLSELVASKEVKISKAKVGGSPAYYIETQKAELDKKLYPHLNEKNRRAFDVLKERQVIRDEPQTPLMRTALRAIPDFSMPFKVTYKGKQHLFWKYYLTADDIVKEKVRAILAEVYPAPKPEPAPVPKPEEVKPEPVQEPAEPKKEVVPEKAPAKPTESIPEKEEAKKEPAPVSKPAEPKKEPFIEAQTTLQEEESEKRPEDEFLDQVEGYLNSLKIRIFSSKIIKKGKELDLKIHIPTPVGTLTYFCKARNKKKSNEGDIAQAYVEGQLLGLPTIYISNGEIPKKLEPILNHKYKNLKVLKL